MILFGLHQEKAQEKLLHTAIFRIKPFLTSSCLAAFIVSVLFLHPATGLCNDEVFALQDEKFTGSTIITGLTQKNTEDGTTIKINADSNLKDYKTFDLFNPPRLVVDVFDSRFQGKEDLYKSTSDLIKKVCVERTHQDKTRLVFYLAGVTGVLYTFDQRDNTIIIDFYQEKQPDSPPVPKIESPGAHTVIHAGRPELFSGSVTGGNRPFFSQWVFSGNQMRYIRYEQGPFTFNAAGTYEVAYLVTDRDGDMASDSITLLVVDDPSADPGALSEKPETRKSAVKSAKEHIKAIWPDNFIGVSLNAGSFVAGNTEDFVLITTGDHGQETLTLTGRNSSVLAINPSLKVASCLRLDLFLGQFFVNKDTDLFFLSSGPRFIFLTKQWMKPYVRCAAVYGRLDCTKMPGKFKNSYGWEYGYGIIASRSSLEFGVEFFYRDISFDYEAPLTLTVDTNHDYIDFSGYSVCASIAYRF